MTISDNDIQQVENEDRATLVALDERGLSAAPDESAAEFAERLRTLRQNLAELETTLESEGAFEVGAVRLKAASRIPAEFFEEAARETEALYKIRVDWVPGFFVNPRFSWLFGGCAFFQYPDFLALFIIRRSFLNHRRWLIYRREELMAHELCHVARVALNSQVFEEHFAYRSSASRFRRIVGPIARRPAESFALLGSCFLLLGAQIVQVHWAPFLPVFPFWLLIAAVLAYLGGRLRKERVMLHTATANLERVFPGYGAAALFRLTDTEIAVLADCRSREDVEGALSDDLRIRVVRQRFSPQAAESPEGAGE